MKATTSVEACANAIVDGFEKRSARVFVPRAAQIIYWIRSLIMGGVGERLTASESATMVPRMERELAALGRTSSQRTAAINDLPSTDADKTKTLT